MSSQPPVEVRHDAARSRFIIEIDGHLAHADYVAGEERIHLTHTFVPPALRGRGLAEQLVRTALGYARDHRLRVVPDCSYVATFITRHPEFTALLA
jgi:uncharacterized protein